MWQGERSGRWPGAFFTIVLVAAVLYLARAVAVPLALAVLLAFLLSPGVNALERRRLRPLPAVLVVVTLAFGVMAAAAWTIGGQIIALAEELPRYRGNIAAKIATWKGAQNDSSLGRLQRMAEDVVGEIEKPAVETGAAAGRPVPVVVHQPLLWRVPSLVESIGSASLVLVLVVFILLRRRDLRNRLLFLLGCERLALTTKAIDEAGDRITRYLVTQCAINGCFGAAVAAGFLLIGLPYAVVWGVSAALLRFVPYAGPWITAALATLLALALFPGWERPVAVVAIIVLLELSIYMAIEPWLYGRGAGVSEVALLVAVAFWTWLWGPIGLVLATPLTVCLAVLGKYVPSLRPLAMLLGDEPAMPAGPLYYQRLVAKDAHEAARVARAHADAHSVERTFDDLLVPALARARRDLDAAVIAPPDEAFVRTATRRIAHELARAALRDGAGGADPRAGRAGAAPVLVHVVGCPARSATDEAALELVVLLIGPDRYRAEVVSSELLVSEMVAAVAGAAPAVVCVASVGRGGLVRARYLMKRLHGHDPDLPVVAACLAAGRRKAAACEWLLSDGAAHVDATVAATVAHVLQLAQHADAREAARAPGRAARRTLPNAAARRGA
jgi:predicted PurR-regulated permease PerM